MAEIIVGRVVFKFQPRPNGDYLAPLLFTPHTYHTRAAFVLTVIATLERKDH